MEKPRYKSPHPVRVTRRLLMITWAWGAVSLLGIGGILYSLFRGENAFLRSRSGRPEERLIRESLPYLDIDGNGLARFLREYRRAIGPPPIEDDEGARRFLDTFLMSTDFFLQGADESRTVRYMMLYDIDVNPCRSPLPRHPIPSAGNRASRLESGAVARGLA